MYNRIRPNKLRSSNTSGNSSRMSSGLPTRYRSPNINMGAIDQPSTAEVTSGHQPTNPTMFANNHKKSYAQVVNNMTDTHPMTPIPSATQSPYVDMNTVMGLLRLYESMRHPA